MQSAKPNLAETVDIYNRLREILGACGPFASNQDISRRFVDERLAPWQDKLPQVDNVAGRVIAVIDFLKTRYSADDENALVLLLRVLSEETDPGDKCHGELADLADELERYLANPNKVDLPSTETVTLPANPYLGLYAFQPENSHLFFGREQVTAELVQTLTESNLVTVLGASGSGKSSLVYAGVVPALQESSDDWEWITFRPDNDPFYRLAQALHPLYQPQVADPAQFIRRMATNLAEDGTYFDDVISQITTQPRSHRLLLIIDQFEELYVHTSDTAQQQLFLGRLLTITNRPNSPLKVVITMRADFLGAALAYQPFAEQINTHNLMLPAMKREELTQAIVDPAGLHGVTFEDGLVDRILDDVGSEAGHLPLLEFALTELWGEQQERMLSHVAYSKIGEVSGALNRHADKIIAQFKGKQSQVRHIFTQLVKPGDNTLDTRRRANQAELATHWDLVKQLADERLLVTNQFQTDASEQVTVELIHEALIRDWSTLDDWIAEDRLFRRWQEQLRVVMTAWQHDPTHPKTLLAGPRLAEAKGWLAENHDLLTAEEQAYINQSLTYQQQQQRQRQLIIGSFFIVTLLAAIIFAALAYSRQQALIETNQARVALLEELAIAKAKDKPNSAVGVLLCLEALNLADAVGLTKPLSDSCLPHTLTKLADYTITKIPVGEKSTEFALAPKSLAPNGQRVALGYKKAVSVWDIAVQPTHHLSIPLESDPRLLLFDATGDQLAIADRANKLSVWDVASGQQIKVQTLPTELERQLTSLAFHPNGTHLALGHRNGEIRLWYLPDNTVALNSERHAAKVESLAFSSDGQWLASGDTAASGKVALWRADTLQPVGQPRPDHADGVKAMAFLAGNSYLAVAQNVSTAPGQGTIKLWRFDLKGFHGIPLRLSNVHLDTISRLRFLPDQNWLISLSSDGTLARWNVDNPLNPRLIGRPIGYTEEVIQDLQFVTRTQQLLALDMQANLIRWETDLTRLPWPEMVCDQTQRNFTFREWQEDWLKQLTAQSYHLPCPKLASVAEVVWLVQNENYEQALESIQTIDDPRLWGYVCDFSSYADVSAALPFCEQVVEKYPDYPALRSSRAFARALLGEIDEEVLTDLEQAIDLFEQDGRPDCVTPRLKWRKTFETMLNQAQTRLSDEQKADVLKDVHIEKGCGVLQRKEP